MPNKPPKYEWIGKFDTEGIEELYDCVHRVVEVKECTVEQAIVLVKFLKNAYKVDDAVRKICGVIPTTEEEIEAEKKKQEDWAKFLALPKREQKRILDAISINGMEELEKYDSEEQK